MSEAVGGRPPRDGARFGTAGRMALAVAIVALSAAPVAAAPAYLFSKPGVSRETYVADASRCSELAGGVDYRQSAARSARTVPVAYPNTTAGAAGAALGLILVTILAGDPDKKVRLVVERTCMADKGYARIRVESDLRRAIEREKDETRRVDRFFAFASATHPVGMVMGE